MEGIVLKDFVLMFKGGEPEVTRKIIGNKQENPQPLWSNWLKFLEDEGHMANPGSYLGYEGKSVSKDGFVADMAVVDYQDTVIGFIVIKANDMNQAVQLSRKCPIFSNPGCTIDVREVSRP